VAVGLALNSSALAALGGDVGSVAADRAAFAAQLRSTAMLQYDVHQIDSGTLTVREYVTRAGQVFAVSWDGPVPPDMHQLLGEYFGRFYQAARVAHQVNPGMHRQFSSVESDLVIQTSGHLRSFHGVAYLPQLVPSGVSLSQLQ
jgi:hypothetical protein